MSKSSVDLEKERDGTFETIGKRATKVGGVNSDSNTAFLQVSHSGW